MSASVAEIAERALRRLGVAVVPVANHPALNTRVSPDAIATGALIELGVIAAGDVPASQATVVPLDTIATLALTKLGVIASDETPSATDLTLARNALFAVHNSLVAQGSVGDWSSATITDAVSEEYAGLTAVHLASSFGKASDPAVVPMLEARIATVQRMMRAKSLALSKLQQVQASLVSQANVGWDNLGVPTAVAEEYTRLTAMALASSFGKQVDPAMLPIFEARVRRMAAVLAGPESAENAVQSVHDDLVARGLARWTVWDIPEAATLPYEMLAANRLAPLFDKPVDPNAEVMARRALLQIIALPTTHDIVVAKVLLMADGLTFSTTAPLSEPDDGLDFGGQPQPPDVPTDPSGENWRGPPGPTGPPGPQGPQGTHGIDGTAGPGGAVVAATPPTASPGALWWDSTGGQLYVRYADADSQQWVVANTSAGVGALGIVNVKDYGAKGDGTTNDAPAIQSAATAAAGGILYFPPDGTYLVGAPTYVSSDTTVIAHGARIVPSPTISSLPNSSNPALGSGLGPVMFTNINWQATTITDHDIRFLGGQYGPLSGAGLGCHGIFLRMVERAHVTEARFQLLNDAIAFLACRNTLMEKCYAEDLLNCAYDHWDGPANATVRDCEMRGGQSGVTAYGVLFNIDSTVPNLSSGVASNVLIDNVRVYGCNTGIFIAPLITSNALRNATVSNCYVSGGDAGIVYSGVTGGTIHNNIIDAYVKSIVVGTGGGPPYPSSQINVTHNLIQNCTATTQYVQAAGTQMVVAHNRAVNSTTTVQAILVDDPATVVLPNYLPGATGGYIINQHPYGGATTPAMEVDADSANNRWAFVQGLKIGTNANVATLSTYEEGTWMPVLRFGGNSVGITYSTQNGTWLRIGKLVYITCDFSLTAKGTSTGAAQVAGLPYSFGGNAAAPGLVVSYYANMVSVTVTPLVTISANIASLLVSAAGGAALTDANFASSTFFRFNGWYRVA